jgi:hypothetical protein
MCAAGRNCDLPSANHAIAQQASEYIYDVINASRRSPISAADRRACYRYLLQWVATRATEEIRRRVVGTPGCGVQYEMPRETQAVVAAAEGPPLVTASRHRPVRVGFLGILGAGNIGNDCSVDAIVGYLREQHPDDIHLDFFVMGPEQISARYNAPASSLQWYEAHRASHSSPRHRAQGAGEAPGPDPDVALGSATRHCNCARNGCSRDNHPDATLGISVEPVRASDILSVDEQGPAAGHP